MAVRTALFSEDRASSAKVIGGSLKFNEDNTQYLSRTPGSSGNQKTWTYSCWFKQGYQFGGHRGAFLKAGATSANYFKINIASDDKLYVMENISSAYKEYFVSSNVFRDPNGWMHVVLRVDTTNGTDAEKVRVYINGTEQAGTRTVNPSLNHDTFVGGTTQHEIGGSTVNTQYFDGHITDVQFVDGSSLGPGSFGFTDPLTNEWRPKDYTGSYGTTGYYLPLDGSAPIGIDQSTKGNNWDAIYFECSAGLDQATGALPILNTVSGGRTATVGVRTDSYAPGKLVLALPLAGIATDVSNRLNGGSTTKPLTITGTTGTTQNRYMHFYSQALYFDGSDDKISVLPSSSADFEFGSGDFTIEYWQRPSDITHHRHLPMIQKGNSGSNNAFDWRLYFNDHGSGDSKTWFEFACGGTSITLQNTSYLNVVDKWKHYAVTRQSGVFRMFINGILVDTDSSTSNAIDDDYDELMIGFNDLGSANDVWFKGYFQDIRIYKGIAKYTASFLPASTKPDITPDTPSGVAYGSELKKVTTGSICVDSISEHIAVADHADLDMGSSDHCVECWVYPEIASQSNYGCIMSKGAPYQLFYKEDVDGLSLFVENADGSGSGYAVYQNNIPASMVKKQWYHVAVTRSSSTWRVFVDGKIKWTGTTSDDVKDTSTALSIGTYNAGTTYELGGFISNFRIVKGSAVYTAEFDPPTGPLTAITNTKLLCCQDPESAIAAAVTPSTVSASGGVSANSFNPFDTDIEYARGKSTGYATLNPNRAGNAATYSNGNLSAQVTGPGFVCSSIPMKTGKWYCEIINTAHGSTHMGIGIVKADGIDAYRQPDESQNKPGWALWHISGDGSYKTMGIGASWDSTTAWNAWGETWGSTNSYDVMGLALDMDKRTITYYKNGRNMGTTENGLTPVIDWGSWIDADSNTVGTGFLFVAGNGQSGATADFGFNFGQKPWKFAPPKGFESANLANLNRPAVVRPDKYFKALTYTGNDSADRDITGVGFQPDFLWIKNREGADWHMLQDAVRGANKVLYSNTADSESTNNTNGHVNSFLRDGFNITAGDSGNVNENNEDYVAWCWKAGGNKGTWSIDGVGYATAAAAGLSGGTIDSTAASVNTEAGFSILQFEAPSSGSATIKHGLGKKPAFWIYKPLGNSTDWYAYHESLGASAWLKPNTSDAATTGNTAAWGGAEPTTSVLTHGAGLVNQNTCILYAWAEVEGFSKFGSYTGNGSTTGDFVYTGFRPAYVMTKATDRTAHWYIWDSTRSPYNQVQKVVWANLANVEEDHAAYGIDFLANGFKIRNNQADTNTDSSISIFMAFAESPLNNLYGGQSNAR